MDVAVTTVAVLPSVHISVGAVIASAAMNISIFFGFSLLTWLSWSDEDDCAENDEEQEPGTRIPAYLRGIEHRRALNLGVVGLSGSGKSSLVNALRGLLPRHPMAAPVGVQATTRDPQSYLLRLDPGGDCFALANPDVASSSKGAGDCFALANPDVASSSKGAGPGGLMVPREVRVWDLPGLGAKRQEAYIDELGLPFFDMVIIVFSQRIGGRELELARSLEEVHKVPHLAVRSQVDLDVESEVADHGSTEEEALFQLRADALSEGLGSVFLVSARQPGRFELAQLVERICHVAKARLRAHLETECPICFECFDQDKDHACCTCHWCGNAVCGRCAALLRGTQAEAQCPFCRRWTALNKPRAL